MEVKSAVPIILLAVLLGLALSLTDVEKIDDGWLQENQDGSDAITPPENNPNKTHKHAQFYVTVNNTPLSFLEPKYQLAANHVHLENNRSDIVHKHEENVTWKDFLDSINASLEYRNNTTYCGEIKNYSYCGEGIVQLNGENVTDLEKEIHQADKLIIILQPEYGEWLDIYREKELPELFRERKVTGRAV